MSTPVMATQYDDLAAALPSAFTEMWGAYETSVPSHTHHTAVREGRAASEYVPEWLAAGSGAARKRRRKVGTRPAGFSVNYGAQGNLRRATGPSVSGGWQRSVDGDALSLPGPIRLAAWAVGIGIALGALSGIVYVESESVQPYSPPQYGETQYMQTEMGGATAR